MKLDKEHMQSLASAILDTYNLTDLTINREMALHGLREDLLSEFEDLNSAATKAARLDHFEIAGASLDDYSEKVLCFDKDRKVVFGIRHMGGNRDVPFVQFTPNFSISSKGEALKLYEIVKPEVKVFHPVYIRFWTKAEIDTDFFGSIYMVSTANRIEELKPWQ